MHNPLVQRYESALPAMAYCPGVRSTCHKLRWAEQPAEGGIVHVYHAKHGYQLKAAFPKTQSGHLLAGRGQVSGQLAAAPAIFGFREQLGGWTILALLFLWISGVSARDLFLQLLQADHRRSALECHGSWACRDRRGRRGTAIGSSAARLMATDWGDRMSVSDGRVVTYSRISTDEINQPYSLGAQRDRLEAYVASQDGWRIVGRYEDRASGKSLARPGLAAVRAAAVRGSLRSPAHVRARSPRPQHWPAQRPD